MPWTPIPYSDNLEIISAIENSTNGLYTLLDSACRTGNSTGQKFCAAIHQAHTDQKSKVIGAPKLGKKESRGKADHFLVKHFAGDVTLTRTRTRTRTRNPNPSANPSPNPNQLPSRRMRTKYSSRTG